MPHWRRPTSCISWCPAVAATASPPRPSRGRPRQVPGASPRPGSEAGRCWRCTDSDDAGRCHSWAEAQLSQRRHGWLRPSRCESSPTSECASAPGMASAAPTNPCMRPSSRGRQSAPAAPAGHRRRRRIVGPPHDRQPIRRGNCTLLISRLGWRVVLFCLLDGRSPEDVAHGHIPGSWPVAIGTLPARLRDADDPLHARLRHRPPAVTTVAVVAGGPTRLDIALALLAEVGIAAVGVVGEGLGVEVEPAGRSTRPRVVDTVQIIKAETRPAVPYSLDQPGRLPPGSASGHAWCAAAGITVRAGHDPSGSCYRSHVFRDVVKGPTSPWIKDPNGGASPKSRPQGLVGGLDQHLLEVQVRRDRGRRRTTRLAAPGPS